MPLPWVRLDTTMPHHPKLIDLIDLHREGQAAAFVWVCSLCYSGAHGTDGFITRSALSRINGKPIHARLLEEVRLWIPEDKVGWRINGWEEYQMMTDESAVRSAKARAAAMKRWHGADA